VTHPRIYAEPTPVDDALDYVESLRSHPNSVVIAPGPDHFDLFRQLCSSVAATGNLVPDAYFAALAIESGSDWITDDRDFTRFPGLRCRHPLDV
jgi:toxin-antitoxin system PIN domain toxin